MSRIRSIKPEFFKHEELFDAERESGLPLRLAFISLWTVVDREGRFKWRPRTLKAECLPYDDCDFARVLDALRTRGFIIAYVCEGVVYGVIPSFNRHQIVNNRESKSELPDPNENNILTRGARVSHATGTPLGQDQGEGKGREGEGDRDANASLANANALADALRVERERKKRAEETANLHLLGSDWNSLAADLGLATIDEIKPGSTREKSALARIREGVDWPIIFTKIRGSPFLRGETSDFRVSFDWIVNPTNLLKVIEGNYNNEVRKAPVRPPAYAGNHR